jgi:hypothetical protein
MVFARKTDDTLASLVKQIDQMVADNKDQNMASFVNFLGSDAESLKIAVRELGTAHNIQNVALVVPVVHENGPDNMKIDPRADVTVVVYKDMTVAANHAFTDGELDETRIATILADAKKILE